MTAKGLRPVERYMMYTDIDFENNLQFPTTCTFNLTVIKPIILTHSRRRDQYCRAYPYILQGTTHVLKFHASLGTVQLEFPIE